MINYSNVANVVFAHDQDCIKIIVISGGDLNST